MIKLSRLELGLEKATAAYTKLVVIALCQYSTVHHHSGGRRYGPGFSGHQEVHWRWICHGKAWLTFSLTLKTPSVSICALKISNCLLPSFTFHLVTVAEQIKLCQRSVLKKTITLSFSFFFFFNSELGLSNSFSFLLLLSDQFWLVYLKSLYLFFCLSFCSHESSLSLFAFSIFLTVKIHFKNYLQIVCKANLNLLTQIKPQNSNSWFFNLIVNFTFKPST